MISDHWSKIERMLNTGSITDGGVPWDFLLQAQVSLSTLLPLPYTLYYLLTPNATPPRDCWNTVLHNIMYMCMFT